MKDYYYSNLEKERASRRKSNRKRNTKEKAALAKGTAIGILAYKRRMLTSARSRAKIGDLPFNLTVEDIHIPDVCPVLGIEIKFSFGQPTCNSPSLDKIVPAMGYTRGNCEVISHRANTLKNNATVPEMEAMYRYYSNKISNTDWMVPNDKT